MATNYWVGIGAQLGGSLGGGTNTTVGVLLSVADLLAVPRQPRPRIRAAAISQTVVSGTLGIDFSGSNDVSIIFANVNADIYEIQQASGYTPLTFGYGLNLDGISSARVRLGQAIAKLGAIDRSVATLAGNSYQWIRKMSDFYNFIMSAPDMINLFGPPPSLLTIAIPKADIFSFEVRVGWTNKITTNSVQNVQTLCF